MVKVQIFIATYNRPVLLLKALHSALNQSFDSFEVIVSDNSTTDETYNLLINNSLIGFKYIKRKPSLPAITHLNAILDCVESDYFMIFHDDDIMHKDMVKTLYNNLVEDDSIVAAGANARMISGNWLSGRLMFRNKNKNLLIQNKDEMASRYFIKNGIVPFSSYLYKNIVSKNLRFDTSKGGKHCDVAFLIDLTSLGKVLMNKQPLMDYYISQIQDSSTNNFLDRIKIINYISKTTSFEKRSLLSKKFRAANLYYELIQENKKLSQFSFNRKIKILSILMKISPFNFFTRATIILIIYRLRLRINRF